jgi:hypothetical protein
VGPSPQVASYGGFHHQLPFPVPFTIACHLWNPCPSVPTPCLLSVSILFPTERRYAFRPALVSLFPFYVYPSVKYSTQSYSNVPVSKTASPILSLASASCVSLISISSRIFRYPSPVAFKKATSFQIVLGPIMLW